MSGPLVGCIAGAALGACAEGGAEPEVRGIEITVAPLSLPGIGGACYDIEVSNGTSVVWSLGDPAFTKLGANQALNNGPLDVLVAANEDDTTVCSGQFGNGAGGAITYVGPCDSTVDSDGVPGNGVQNTVTLWVDGLYATGLATDVGEWRDPCGTSGCSIEVDCDANADSLAEFNFSVMRSANQGFFDIAVNFEDIFCSAKFDTCYDDGPDEGSALDPIRLLHGADSVRDWTGVVGFTCTAGADTQALNTVTHLLYSKIQITCGTDTFTLNPNIAEGQSTATAGGKTLHYAVYRGVNQQQVSPGLSANLLYWNLAFSLDDLTTGFPTTSCTLDLTATADDATPSDGHIDFVAGVPIGSGVTYPYIVVEADLTTTGGAACQQNELDGGIVVKTVYAGNTGEVLAPTVMCSQFNGTAATGTGGAGCN
jgi:hypothetical protein